MPQGDINPLDTFLILQYNKKYKWVVRKSTLVSGFSVATLIRASVGRYFYRLAPHIIHVSLSRFLSPRYIESFLDGRVCVKIENTRQPARSVVIAGWSSVFLSASSCQVSSCRSVKHIRLTAFAYVHDIAQMSYGTEFWICIASHYESPSWRWNWNNDVCSYWEKLIKW